MATERLRAAFGNSWGQAQVSWNQLRSLFPLRWDLIADSVAVTALPTKDLYIGRQILFKAALGIYWVLVYTKEETFPWAKIGGPPLRVEDTANRTTTAVTFQTTNAPSVNAPLAGDYRVGWGAQTARVGNITTGDGGAKIEVFKAGVATGLLVEVRDDNQHRGAPAFMVRPLTLAAGNAMQSRYRANVAGTGAEFDRLFIELDPTRVG